MSEAAILHQEPEHILEGPPRGQLPKGYEQLFYSLESTIKKADDNGSVWGIPVMLHDGYQTKHLRVRAECIGKRLKYEVKNHLGAIVLGYMDRSEA